MARGICRPRTEVVIAGATAKPRPPVRALVRMLRNLVRREQTDKK